jgi:hypothetical protein|tara:strand:+ start:556 stop:825 length:270 start_codon:yes stop_codon:yes gene_type:complete
MNGFLIGLGVSLFLTFINAAFIWYSKRISGASSLVIIQAGMLVKFMLGVIISFCIIKLFKDINLWAYTLTLGMFVCTSFPITAYIMTQK